MRTRKNGGVFVPEMRLTPMIPGLIMMPFGLAGFGICVEHKTHWLGPGKNYTILRNITFSDHTLTCSLYDGYYHLRLPTACLAWNGVWNRLL